MLIKSLIKKFLSEEFFLHGQLKTDLPMTVIESVEPELCSKLGLKGVAEKAGIFTRQTNASIQIISEWINIQDEGSMDHSSKLAKV